MDAPSIDPDGDQLQPKEEQRLHRHYEVSGDTGTATGTGRAAITGEPVVGTEAVPVERVRLSKEQVADTETVSGEVRKERIDTDGIDGDGTFRHAR